jgi:hypothetical protein
VVVVVGPAVVPVPAVPVVAVEAAVAIGAVAAVVVGAAVVGGRAELVVPAARLVEAGAVAAPVAPDAQPARSATVKSRKAASGNEKAITAIRCVCPTWTTIPSIPPLHGSRYRRRATISPGCRYIQGRRLPAATCRGLAVGKPNGA